MSTPVHLRGRVWTSAICKASYFHAQKLRCKWKSSMKIDKVTCKACIAKHRETTTVEGA